jgi:ABC-type sugar transport system substrate-binding protein
MKDPNSRRRTRRSRQEPIGRSVGQPVSRGRVRVLGITAVVTAASLIAAACSSSGSSTAAGSSPAASNPAVSASSSAPANASSSDAASIAAGQAAAKKLGAVAKLPTETVGNILFQGSDETTQRIAADIKAGAADLGWKYIQCDGQGTPNLWTSCANTLLNEGANVLISAGIDPSVLQASLSRAKSSHVLFFNTEALVPPAQASLYAGNYAPVETDASDTIAQYIISKLDTLPASQRTIALINYNAVYGLELRTNELIKKLTAAGIKVVAQHTLNFASVTQDTTTTVNNWLTQYPNLGAIFTVADAALPVMAQVVAARKGDVQFPKRPLLAAFLDSLQNLQAVRTGTADAVVSNGTGLSSVVALDQAAEYFARHTPLATGNAFGNSVALYGVPLNQPVLITKTQNMPAAGQYAASPYNTLAFFKAKWDAEFNLSGN